jgi:hypothetical protein
MNNHGQTNPHFNANLLAVFSTKKHAHPSIIFFTIDFKFFFGLPKAIPAENLRLN